MHKIPGYSVKKAAQVCAFFARREGGDINVLKLSKLVYLSEREFLSQYDSPMLYDLLVSMPHGPVTTATLDYISGHAENPDWSAVLSGRAGYSVGLANKDLQVSDLDALSVAEIDVLQLVWDKFGKMNQYQLRDWTHANCLEWEDPKTSSSPIPYDRVLKFLNKPHSELLAQAIEEERSVVAIFDGQPVREAAE
jgi:uncharacterized phage-associated protein